MSHRFQLYTYPVLVKLLFNGIYDFGNSKILPSPTNMYNESTSGHTGNISRVPPSRPHNTKLTFDTRLWT